ncbi:MAG: tRNA (N(6)-L-threonylcarbamoyladenosine(37)-C(2))-methylthiotransferase MtaB [Syntrophales bacterium]|nr:tRNA (N(6)-L-threonylcarbamoyladenosine(37)-C(2))-methylthiotransferase MtaB [Syntrophales bacterium]
MLDQMGKLTAKDKRKVALFTLGCKANQCDTAAIGGILLNYGFTIVRYSENADFCIINTCTVTASTDSQCRQLIRKVARNNPAICIIVTGCYAERAPEELLNLQEVTAVVTNKAKDKIPKILSEISQKEHLHKEKIHIKAHTWENDLHSSEHYHMPDHTRVFLKIQDGCDERCSYCIVPYTRGPSRSLPEDAVLRRIEKLSEMGFKEVVLTGIHLGAYGCDLKLPSTLSKIIERIEKAKLVKRLRLSSIEPLEIDEMLLELLARSEILCPHLHIPLQSGDDRILRAMNRKYTTSQFLQIVDKIIKTKPDIAIGTDVIVGFPGEDERSFNNTLQYVQNLPLAYIHVFPYSPRPGTQAINLSNTTTEKEKKERVKVLQTIGRSKKDTFMKNLIGKRVSVLLERVADEKTATLRGLTEHYMPALVANCKQGSQNTIVDTFPEKVDGGFLIGRAIDHE